MKDKLRQKKWYPYAVAACIAVAFYVILTHLGSITSGLLTFIGYFDTVILGCVIAYIMNPLAMLFERTVFAKVGRGKLKWSMSIGAAVILLILMLGFLLRTLIPQLMDSLVMLVSNMDVYLASLHDLIDKWGLSEVLRSDRLFDSSEDIVKRVQAYFSQNAGSVMDASAAAGRSIVKWVIAFVLSVYLLSAKTNLKNGVKHLLSTLMPEKRFNSFVSFISRCDRILVSYIVSSLIDAIIIGVLNLIFMSVMGMEYAGLISVVVAVTNLVPTFGPIVGGAVGALILLLVKPVHALIFVIFTFILQFIDPYFIKPKLFGNTLGVSGLLIVVSVLVCGRMFGVPGILLSIPLAAILSFVYKEAILPALERRAARRKAEAAQ
ncbi:MAG: AI-2E family transporter [Mogibacterium sp.]|nr:AI-2E family transporter [Mogibacterium sp.]